METFSHIATTHEALGRRHSRNFASRFVPVTPCTGQHGLVLHCKQTSHVVHVHMLLPGLVKGGAYRQTWCCQVERQHAAAAAVAAAAWSRGRGSGWLSGLRRARSGAALQEEMAGRTGLVPVHLQEVGGEAMYPWGQAFVKAKTAASLGSDSSEQRGHGEPKHTFCVGHAHLRCVVMIE